MKWLKGKQPWKPAPYELADASAIQALISGTADAEQQKRGIQWIIEVAAGTYDQSFYPGADEGRRNTDFSEGKRFVGNSIVKLSRVNVGSLRRKEHE